MIDKKLGGIQKIVSGSWLMLFVLALVSWLVFKINYFFLMIANWPDPSWWWLVIFLGSIVYWFLAFKHYSPKKIRMILADKEATEIMNLNITKVNQKIATENKPRVYLKVPKVDWRGFYTFCFASWFWLLLYLMNIVFY